MQDIRRHTFSLCGPNASCALKLQLADGGFSHLELLDLPGDGHRERVDNFDVFGDLERGNFAFAKSVNVFSSSRRIGVKPDPCDYLFSILRIGNADHLNIADAWTGVQKFFDLARDRCFLLRE